MEHSCHRRATSAVRFLAPCRSRIPNQHKRKERANKKSGKRWLQSCKNNSSHDGVMVLVKRFSSWEKCGWMTRNSAHEEKSRRHVNLVSLVSLFCLHGISRGRFGGGWGIGGVGGGRNLPHGSRELRLQAKVSSCCLKKNCLRTARQSDRIRFLSDRIDYLHYLSHIWSYLHDLLQSSCCAEFDLDNANWDCLDHLLQVYQGELTQKDVSDNQNRKKETKCISCQSVSECLWVECLLLRPGLAPPISESGPRPMCQPTTWLSPQVAFPGSLLTEMNRASPRPLDLNSDIKEQHEEQKLHLSVFRIIPCYLSVTL